MIYPDTIDGMASWIAVMVVARVSFELGMEKASNCRRRCPQSARR
jgi:hypothetical protein